MPRIMFGFVLVLLSLIVYFSTGGWLQATLCIGLATIAVHNWFQSLKDIKNGQG